MASNQIQRESRMNESHSKAEKGKDTAHQSAPAPSLDGSGISLADLIDGSVQGLAVLQRGRILYASPTFAEIFGEKPEALIHARLEQFITAASWKRLLMAAKAPQSGMIELGGKSAGQRIWLQARTRQILWHGKQALQLTAVDMTGRRALEQQRDQNENGLRDIINSASAAIFVKDLEGHYIIVNDAFCQQAGVPKDKIVGRTAWDIFPTEAAELEAADDFVIREKKPTSLREIIVNWEAGERYLLFNKFPLLDRMGNVYAICGITTDMTELRSMEHQLRHAQKADALGQLSSGFIHDFNNYLAIISGNLELAQGIVDKNSRMARYIGAAQSAAGKSARLTQRLMSFVRSKPVAPEYLDTGAVARDLELLLQRTLDRRYKLEISCPARPWNVYVDRSKLESALVNLAINGRDAMPEGGVLTITVANHNFTAESPQRPAELAKGQYVEFTVTDNGVGMAADVRKKAVEPFFTTKTGRQGMGLGLSLVYRFVTEAGGFMKIDSEPGKGCSVHLFLPRAAAPARTPRRLPVKRSASPSEDR